MQAKANSNRSEANTERLQLLVKWLREQRGAGI
jgi:hypothetical protein